MATRGSAKRKANQTTEAAAATATPTANRRKHVCRTTAPATAPAAAPAAPAGSPVVQLVNANKNKNKNKNQNKNKNKNKNQLLHKLHPSVLQKIARKLSSTRNLDALALTTRAGRNVVKTERNRRQIGKRHMELLNEKFHEMNADKFKKSIAAHLLAYTVQAQQALKASPDQLERAGYRTIGQGRGYKKRIISLGSGVKEATILIWPNSAWMFRLNVEGWHFMAEGIDDDDFHKLVRIKYTPEMPLPRKMNKFLAIYIQSYFKKAGYRLTLYEDSNSNSNSD